MKNEENKEFFPIVTLRTDPFATCIPKSTQQEKRIGLCTPRMKLRALCLLFTKKKVFFILFLAHALLKGSCALCMFCKNIYLFKACFDPELFIQKLDGS
jgi:predicted metal-binding protein